MKARSDDDRRRELAKIHLAAKQLGMARDAYEDMLWTVARVRSARDLDSAGRARVLDHLKRCGFKSAKGKRPRHGTPHNINSAGRGAQISRIEALLADAKRPWAYADALAARLCKVDAVAFCDAQQLHKIIAALTYDARRRLCK